MELALAAYRDSVTQRLVVIGAGGFGREVLDVIDAINSRGATKDGALLEVLGILADGVPDRRLLEPYGARHLGPVGHLEDLPEDVGYVIGIGSPQARRRIDEQGRGRPCPVLVHPSATIAREVTIGPGTVICSHVSITNNIRIGRHVHINLNCTVGHDAVLDDYVTLSPLVAISGKVHACEGAYFGTGATTNPGVTIGANAVVGSGAAVVRDVAPEATVIGVPAKPR